MNELYTLAAVMTGLRLVSVILSLAILTWWTPALWRVLVLRYAGRDPVRAIWVPLAVSVLLFQVRWLYPGLEDMTRLRLWVVAQAAIVLTLLLAIYYQGAGEEGFRLRRAMLAHFTMLAIAFCFAFLVRR